MANANRRVDPISAVAFSLFGYGLLILMGLTTQPTLLPDTAQFAITQDIALAVVGMSGVLGIVYNGANLGQLGGVEMTFVILSVIVGLSINYVPTVINLVEGWGIMLYASILAYGMVTFSYLILAYGSGVDWYPIGVN